MKPSRQPGFFPSEFELIKLTKDQIRDLHLIKISSDSSFTGITFLFSNGVVSPPKNTYFEDEDDTTYDDMGNS